MIRNRNISANAAIDLTKLQGLGAQGPITGEVHYVAKSGIQSRTWIDGRVSGSNLHKTINDALSACVASRGDRIYVCPYHTETITGVGGFTLDKTGVDILGLGRYDARPVILMDGAATVSMLVTAANMSLENCVFTPGHADINYLMHVSAKGFRFAHNKIQEITTNENWIDVIHAGTADNDYDGLELVGNEIDMTDTASVTAIDLLKDANDVKIIQNSITGDFDATPFAPIYCASTEVQKQIQILHNMIHNLHNADAVSGIAVANTASTGWMMYNHVYSLDVAGETPFLTGATGLYCSQNFTTYQGTLSGFEYPAIGTLS